MENSNAAVSSGGTTAGVPESSLSWCLLQLQKTENPTKATAGGGQGKEEERKEDARKARAGLWRALVAIRTQHIKGGISSIIRFRARSGLPLLLKLLQQSACDRKTLDLTLSILANCCTEIETRAEVRKLGGIPLIVEILKNVSVVTVQNRAARTLGNLAIDSENSELIHFAGGVPLLILCLAISPPASSSPTLPSTPAGPVLECAQSAARALQYLSDTPLNRLSLLSKGALPALVLLIAPEYPPGLRRASLRALNELTRGCGAECAREVVRSGALDQLGALVMEEADWPSEEVGLKILANLCSQGCLRPLVGSLGVIPKFVEEAKGNTPKSALFFRALCLCCKEAVNRVKVKESGGLEVLIGSLSVSQSHPFSRLAVLAFVDFVYDEAVMEQLQGLGLVPLLVARLVAAAKGEGPASGEADTSTASSSELMSTSCFDSFDFPPPEANRKDDGGKEHGQESSSFLSLRSWLLSEGLISCEGELLSPTATGVAEGELGTCPPTSLSDRLSLFSGPSSSTTPTPTPLTVPSPPAVKSPCGSRNLPPMSTSTPKPNHVTSATFHPHRPTPLSPSKPPSQKAAPPSPSKARSPNGKRAGPHLLGPACTLPPETPPSLVQAPTYQHPYHPEPWTAESPVLLLLSRFSQSVDPSSALGNAAAISGLLYYLTQHREPSSRCFRVLCRLSCNPNCLESLVRTGAVAFIWLRLCLGQGAGDRQTGRVKTKVRQLGKMVLNNLRIQSESSFGSGVLSHIMLSGSEVDRLHCALSLPLINSNKTFLKKLLLDNGGLQLAVEALCCQGDADDCVLGRWASLSSWLQPPHPASPPSLQLLYLSLLVECLSNLPSPPALELRVVVESGPGSGQELGGDMPPPLKKQCFAPMCPYLDSRFDLVFVLDDSTRVPANMEAVSGGRDGEAGSEYFRALLRGGFWEGGRSPEEGIPIRDVTPQMLLPVLHYLHGCSASSGREETEETGNKRIGGHCHILGSLNTEGLGEEEMGSNGTTALQKTPLTEAMRGANMFLVSGLQRELEDLGVSLILTSAASQPGSVAQLRAQPPDHTEQKLNPRTQGSLEWEPGKGSAEDGRAGLPSSEKLPCSKARLFKVPVGPRAKSEATQARDVQSSSQRQRRPGMVTRTGCERGPEREPDLRRLLKPNQELRMECGPEAPCITSDLSQLSFALSSWLDSELILEPEQKMGDIVSRAVDEDSSNLKLRSASLWALGSKMSTRSDYSLESLGSALLCTRDQKKSSQSESTSQFHFLSDWSLGSDLEEAYDDRYCSIVNLSTPCFCATSDAKLDGMRNAVLGQDCPIHSTAKPKFQKAGCSETRGSKPEDVPAVGALSLKVDPAPESKRESWPLVAHLPWLYCFSQLHGYTRLARACLSVLLWPRAALARPPTSLVADCLRQLAEQERGAEALTRDLMLLAAQTLS
nr:armadillo repeat-containing protein 5 [Paramormyrops kingsleyae]